MKGKQIIQDDLISNWCTNNSCEKSWCQFKHSIFKSKIISNIWLLWSIWELGRRYKAPAPGDIQLNSLYTVVCYSLYKCAYIPRGTLWLAPSLVTTITCDLNTDFIVGSFHQLITTYKTMCSYIYNWGPCCVAEFPAPYDHVQVYI